MTVVPSLLEGSYQSLYVGIRSRGQNLSNATGFLCLTGRGPMLITARHVVTGKNNDTGELLSRTGAVPDELAVRYITLSQHGPIFQERMEALSDKSGKPRWREHPTLGARMDCVSLILENASGIGLFPYMFNLAIRDEPKIVYGPSDPVSVVGYPFGRDAGGYAIWAAGFVASEPSIDYMDLPVLLIDCRTRPGQSGAPVILQRNSGMVLLENGGMVSDGRPRSRLLGVYSGRINAESDIGLVWKAHAVAEIL